MTDQDKTAQVAELRERLQAIKDAQFAAQMSDNWYFTSGRKKQHDDEIRALSAKIAELGVS